MCGLCWVIVLSHCRCDASGELVAVSLSLSKLSCSLNGEDSGIQVLFDRSVDLEVVRPVDRSDKAVSCFCLKASSK
jgi:hypothetical protein